MFIFFDIPIPSKMKRNIFFSLVCNWLCERWRVGEGRERYEFGLKIVSYRMDSKAVE